MDPAIASALTREFSVMNVMEMTPNEFCDQLVSAKIVKSSDDFKLLILEAIQRAAVDDDEFPIHFYTKNEPMSENGRTVSNVECLTDDYIAAMLDGC